MTCVLQTPVYYSLASSASFSSKHKSAALQANNHCRTCVSSNSDLAKTLHNTFPFCSTALACVHS